jgi:hypothetical protein
MTCECKCHGDTGAVTNLEQRRIANTIREVVLSDEFLRELSRSLDAHYGKAFAHRSHMRPDAR